MKVTTQAQLDRALADNVGEIIIDSPAGAWLRVDDSDSSSVVAWGSSRVVAWGSSSVEAWDSSSVEAGRYVAVHLHSQRVTLSGGVVIDMTKVDRTRWDHWRDLTGVKVIDGHVTLYKAVDKDLMAGHSYRPTRYEIGTVVVCPDWRDDSECGGGLHVSPTPSQAARYADSDPRFLECRVEVGDIRCIDSSKVKCRRLTVVREVDRWREPVAAVTS